MRAILFLAIFLSFVVPAQADKAKSYEGWILPGAKLKEHGVSPTVMKSANEEVITDVTSGFGQYGTEEPFEKVVAFYVKKSNLSPPNWSILGRKYPGTDVYMPAHFYHMDTKRESPSVTALHYIRKQVATFQLLVTDEPDLGFLAVTVSRAEGDPETVIQIIFHPKDRMK